ncbi:Uncharacterized protein family (UPF0104) [Opitutaceae bacterium TAV1]|nr:Uncharacterized protein family (UPF0104) [Opitutaceae bacterium TAV1]
MWWIDVDAFIGIFKKLSWAGVLWLFIIYQCTQICRAWRMSMQLPAENRPDMLSLVCITALHQFFNHVIPARMGELSFPFLLKKFTKVNSASALAVLISVRLQEIFVLSFLIILALLGVLVTTADESQGALRWSLLGGGGFCFVSLIFIRIYLKNLLAGFSKIIQWLMLRIKSQNMLTIFIKVREFIIRVNVELAKPVSLPKQSQFFTVTVLIWVNTFFFFHEILRLSGVKLQFQQTVVGASLANFSQALPLNTIGSFGSLELGWTVGFSMIGLDARKAMAVGISMHALILAFLAAFSAVGWIFLTAKKDKDR